MQNTTQSNKKASLLVTADQLDTFAGGLVLIAQHCAEVADRLRLTANGEFLHPCEPFIMKMWHPDGGTVDVQCPLPAGTNQSKHVSKCKYS